MGERTSYVPGTFCWVELITSDLEAATRFYAGLLGWDHEDAPVGELGVYRMLRVGLEDVAGARALSEEESARGQPPSWLSYVSVADVADATARVASAGGAVLREPFEVVDAGRTAVVADPTGAVLALWEPRTHVGASLVNDPGALCLNQLNTPDPEAAADFLRTVFGWDISLATSDPVEYWGIWSSGALNGGMMGIPGNDPMPAHWLAYFTTADLDAAADEIPASGGAVLVPPSPIQSGRILVAQDPQGAPFGLFEGDVDP